MEHILSRLESAFAPQQVVASDSQVSLTANALAQRVRATIDQLQARNIGSLALHADNSLDWLVIDLACQAAEICLLPLPTFFSREQLEYALDEVPVDAIVCENTDLFRRILPIQPDMTFDAHIAGYPLLLTEYTESKQALPDGTTKVTFTSGSTGNPRGVCLGTKQLIRQARALEHAVKLDRPTHLCLLPLSTLLENVAGIYTPLLAGGDVIVPGLSEIGFEGSSSLNPDRFTAAISRYSPESLILTPQLLLVLLATVDAGWQVPESLQFVAVGGGRVSPAMLARAHAAGIPAYEGYGLSECASVVSLNTPHQCDHSSSGKPLPHLEVDIEDGEIVIAGNAMLGYVGEPDSWGQERIHSGDLGSINEEGFLSISGRQKNVLISSFGRNINPEWVESELMTRPALAECLVLGDERPFCVALVRPHNPSETDESIQHQIDKVNRRLPDYARVKQWHRLQDPLAETDNLVTENGRPKREAIADHFQPHIESLYDNHARTHTG